MSRVLAKAAMVVGAVAAIASGVGAIAGTGLLGATLAGAAGTLSTIGIIGGGVAAALSVAGALTAAKPAGRLATFTPSPEPST